MKYIIKYKDAFSKGQESSASIEKEEALSLKSLKEFFCLDQCSSWKVFVEIAPNHYLLIYSSEADNTLVITKFHPKPEVVLDAIQISFKVNNVSPCAKECEQIIYSQSKISKKTWISKWDASFHGNYNESIETIIDYIVIPEYDAVLSAVESFNNINIH